jgi:hypothetical protein
MVSNLYNEWYGYLEPSLQGPEETAFFGSIRHNTTNSTERWMTSLKRLSIFLARRSGRGVMVFIDEYETPVIQASDFIGHGVLPTLLNVSYVTIV